MKSAFRWIPLVAITCAAPLAQAAPPSTPIGHWAMDAAVGARSVEDSSGHGNTGRCGAALSIGSGRQATARCPTYGVAGRIGKAMGFNGTNQFFVVDNSIPGSFTVSLWLRTTAKGAGDVGDPAYAGSGIVWSDIGGDAADMIPMALVGGHLAFGTACGGDDYDTLTSKTSVATGDWVFVVVTRDQASGTKKIYVNGKLDAEQAHTSTCALDANKVIAVGGNPLDDRYFEGSLDDLRFYDHTLPAADIAALYKGADSAGAAAQPGAAATSKASTAASGIPPGDLPKLGAPVYPGAVLDGDYGPNKYVSEPGHIDAHLITMDSFDKVFAYYKQHMPAGSGKPYKPSDDSATFEIGKFGDANYLGVSILKGFPGDASTGEPASGTQIDIVHYTQGK